MGAVIEVRPIGQRAARDWIDEHHRHLSAPRGDVIRLSVWEGDRMVGVACAGRPSARLLDDGLTLEVHRVAMDGTRNACSMAYGQLRRAGVALGWRRFITYTLASEQGASLRASGWVSGGWTDGGEWSRPSRERTAAEQSGVKRRWVYPRDAWRKEIKRWTGHE